MAVTAFSSGSQTAVISTEHTLADINQAGTYVLYVDKVNMADGDVLELRGYKMVLTGGTRRVAYLSRTWDAALTDDMIEVSLPISNELTDTGAVRFTLTQTAGTARVFPYVCLKHA